MNEILFSSTDLKFFRDIQSNPPLTIWCNYEQFVFEFEGYYYELNIKICEAASRNESDEILSAELKRHDGEFIPDDEFDLICKNPVITSLHIVRSFIYFSDYHTFSGIEKKRMKIGYFLRRIFARKPDPLQYIKENSTGVTQQFLCHPNSKKAQMADQQFANLNDIGIIIGIGELYLPAYISYNYGFEVTHHDKFLFQKTEIEEITDLYELIPVLPQD